MKNIILFLMMIVSGSILAQNEPIKVVFDVTSENPKVHRSAAAHLRLMAEAYPDSEFEMVIYSGAYQMVDKKSSAAGETLAKVVQKDNVSIVVCENTMKRHKMEASDLIPGIGSVPDGIFEIVMKQNQGWAYIKEVK